MLRVKTVRDKVKMIPDANGQVHILIASTELRQVLEVIVLPSGVVQRRVIRSDVSPWVIDGAFDARGILHVLIDTEHMVLEDGIWRKADRTPWQELGLKAQAASFVSGAPNLIWSFRIDGREFNTPGRWDFYAIGGAAGAIAWPWFSHGTRAVLVSESASGYGPWIVLEPEGKEDTMAIAVAADRQGNVQIVYRRSRGGISDAIAHRYLRIDAEILAGGRTDTLRSSELQAGSRKYLGVEGQSIEMGHVEGKSIELGQLLHGFTSSGPVFIPRPPARAAMFRVSSGTGETLSALTVGKPRDEWWGKGFPIRYSIFSHNVWSEPIDVGVADVSSFWGIFWDACDITSTGQSRAFLAWPTEQAIVGRWVERLP